MMRASVFRLSPLLLMAAALVALAVLFAPGAQPAQAQTTTVWSATLTVQNLSTATVGCHNSISSARCSSTSSLTDDDFTYNGVNYEMIVVSLITTDGTFAMALDKAIPSGLSLNVDGTAFSVASGTLSNANKNVQWTNSGLSWSVGDTISLSLTAPSTNTPPPPAMNTEYWSDTLSVKTVDYGFGCGYRTGQPKCTSAFETANTFVYHGAVYNIVLVHVAYGDTLQFILDADPVDSDGTRTERARMALNVGTGALSKQFLVKDAMVSYGIADGGVWTNEDAWVLTWTNSGLSWAEGETRSLSLVTLPVGGL